MKRPLIIIPLLAIVVCLPCYAIKSMMFNDIDQYIERAEGIWVVKVLKRLEGERGGPRYEVTVLQSLKGSRQATLIVRELGLDCRELPQVESQRPVVQLA